MSDLIVFGALVALVLAAGIAVGMIVAGRLDRLLAPSAQPEEPVSGDELPAEETPS